MPITLKDEYAKTYLHYLGELRNTKIELRKSVEKEIADLDIQISQVASQMNGTSKKPDKGQQLLSFAIPGYDSNLTWEKKAEVILHYLGKPATTTDIVEQLLMVESTMPRKKAIGSISATLSVKAKKYESAFTVDVNERKEFIYGLKEWDKK